MLFSFPVPVMRGIFGIVYGMVGLVVFCESFLWVNVEASRRPSDAVFLNWISNQMSPPMRPITVGRLKSKHDADPSLLVAQPSN